MDEETINHIISFYTRFMTAAEQAALRHIDVSKRLEANETTSARLSFYERNGWLTKDPEALELIWRGEKALKEDIALRVLSDSKNDIQLNYCPKCCRLARTPQAKQCRYCFYTWHNATN